MVWSDLIQFYKQDMQSTNKKNSSTCSHLFSLCEQNAVFSLAMPLWHCVKELESIQTETVFSQLLV